MLNISIFYNMLVLRQQELIRETQVAVRNEDQEKMKEVMHKAEEFDHILGLIKACGG